MNEIEKQDFINRDTIIDYGKNICMKINNILEKASLLSTVEKIKTLDENAKHVVESLDEFLNTTNKKDNNIIDNTLKFLGLKNKDINKDKSYEEYKNELDYILKAIEEQKQKTLLDIDLKKSVIEEINPLLKELSVLIEKGEEQKDKFTEEVNKLDNTYDTFSENINRKRMLDIFSDHLYQLKQSNILYQDQIQGFYIQINNDEQILKDCNIFLNTTSYILMSQGAMSYNLNKQKTSSDFINEVNTKSIYSTKENNLSLQETLKNIEKNTISHENKTNNNKTYQRR